MHAITILYENHETLVQFEVSNKIEISPNAQALTQSILFKFFVSWIYWLQTMSRKYPIATESHTRYRSSSIPPTGAVAAIQQIHCQSPPSTNSPLVRTSHRRGQSVMVRNGKRQKSPASSSLRLLAGEQ